MFEKLLNKFFSWLLVIIAAIIAPLNVLPKDPPEQPSAEPASQVETEPVTEPETDAPVVPETEPAAEPETHDTTKVYGAYGGVNVPYGPDERQILDLYIPDGVYGEAGLVLFIHGGSFVSGDKLSYNEDVYHWYKKGYSSAALNYHYVSDTTDIYTIMDDVTAALGCIKEIGASRNIRYTKVIICGYSAGAHISLLYCYSRVDEAPIKPVACVSYAGTTDLTMESLYYEGRFGAPEASCEFFSKVIGYDFTISTKSAATEALKEASPIYHTWYSTVPTIICHGKKDEVVPYGQAQWLNEVLDYYQVEHEFITFATSGHGLTDNKLAGTQAEYYFDQYAEKYLP